MTKNRIAKQMKPIKGMIYASEEEAYDYGTCIGGSIIDFINYTLDNLESATQMPKECSSAVIAAGAICGGYADDDGNLKCHNMVIPRQFISYELQKVLEPVDISEAIGEALINNSARFSVENDEKYTTYKELSNSFEKLGIDSDLGIEALIDADIIDIDM